MMTTKKRRGFQDNLVVAAAVGALLTACGPPGARQLRQGEQDIQAGRYGEAAMVLKEATGILSNAPPAMQSKAWNLLGLAQMNSGQLDIASADYSKALQLDRNNAAADYNQGCLRMQQGNFPGAADYLTTYITLRPKDVQGYLRLGTAHLHYAAQQRANADKTRFLDAARHEFEKAESVTATAEAPNALGVIDLQRSHGADFIRAAATNFSLALNRDPHCAPALLNLAIVSQQYLNNPRQALQCYQRYLAVSPPQPHVKEVTKLAHDLELSTRITFTPETATAPVPAPAPRPSPPPARGNVVATNPNAVNFKPPPAQEPPVQAVVPTPAPAPAQDTAPAPALASVPTPAPAPQPQPPPQMPTPPATAPASPDPASTAKMANEVPAPVVLETNLVPRKAITQRLNPMTWFSGKPKAQNGGAAPEPAAAAEQALVPPGTRYEYPPTVTPIPGDRAQAKRLLAEAVRARQAGDMTQCLRAYKDAIAADPTFYDACYGCGLAAIEARQYPAALEELHRALALQVDSAEARYAFAWTLQKRGYTEDAVHELGKLLGEHPDDVPGHLLLGNLYAEKLRQPKLAREHYIQALELDPNNAQAANVRAWLKSN
jgi:tetratricopeptide (TPR) repeat protein